MKKILVCISLLAAFLTYQVSVDADDAIIIYSSLEQYRGEELQKQLKDNFPQYDIRVMYMPTAKAAAKVSVEETNTDAAIIVGLETSYMEKVKGSLANIDGYSNLDYIDGLKPLDHDNRYVTWERQAGSIVLNEDVLEKYNLPAPTSYEDLLDPMYKGLIAMPDPKSSGTGYFFYKNMVNTRGDEAALTYFDNLSNNIKQFTESGSGPMKLLKQGEVAIGLALTFQAVNEINSGSNFTLLCPEEGSPYSLTGTAMIEGKEHIEGVSEIFSFIVNDFLVYDKEYFSPEKILTTQSNKIENYPQDIIYADMKGISDMSEKERLLNLWKF